MDASTAVTSTGPEDTTGSEDTTGPEDTTTLGEDTSTGAPLLSFEADVYDPIIQPICTCHVAGSGGLLMGDTAASAYVALVNAPSSSPLVYVAPGSAIDSYMHHKVRGTQASVGGAGVQMPMGGSPLTPEELDTISLWIDQGALP